MGRLSLVGYCCVQMTADAHEPITFLTQRYLIRSSSHLSLTLDISVEPSSRDSAQQSTSLDFILFLTAIHYNYKSAEIDRKMCRLESYTPSLETNELQSSDVHVAVNILCRCFVLMFG